MSKKLLRHELGNMFMLEKPSYSQIWCTEARSSGELIV